MIEMTPKAQRELEERWALQKEAISLLRIVDHEWRSDASSVACFDARIVGRTREVLARLDQLKGPFDE
jgi:hypothetical protein